LKIRKKAYNLELHITAAFSTVVQVLFSHSVVKLLF